MTRLPGSPPWESMWPDWSPERAWFLGMMMGSGAIRIRPWKNSTHYEIRIAAPEVLLRKWLDLYDPSRPLPSLEHPRNMGHRMSRRYPRIYLYDSALVTRLLLDGFNLHTGEQFRLPRVPPEFQSHFLRGIWDTAILKPDGIALPHRKYFAQIYMRIRAMLHPHVPRLVFEVNQNCSLRGREAWRVLEFLYGDSLEHLRNEDHYQLLVRLRQDIPKFAAMKCLNCEGTKLRRYDYCADCLRMVRIAKVRRVCSKKSCRRIARIKGLCRRCYLRSAGAPSRSRTVNTVGANLSAESEVEPPCATSS